MSSNDGSNKQQALDMPALITVANPISLGFLVAVFSLILSLPVFASNRDNDSTVPKASFTLSGSINVDGTNQPVANAFIWIKGQDQPARTDQDGSYSISVSSGATSLDLMPQAYGYIVNPWNIWLQSVTSDVTGLNFTAFPEPGVFIDVAAGWLAENDNTRNHAWGDVDGDGDDDLYLVREGQENLLLLNSGGTFENGTVPPLNDGGNGRSACWGDFDTDGDQDLYLVNTGADPDSSRNQLMINESSDGNIVFTRGQQGLVQIDGAAGQAAWLDLDKDNLLDLFLTRKSCVDNLLLLGKHDLDEGLVSGLTDTCANNGFAWADFNNDDLLDCFITGDRPGRILILLQNESQEFVRTYPVDLDPNWAAKSVAVADFDNDGDFDAFLTRWSKRNELLVNDGSGNFHISEPDTFHDKRQSQVAAWGDYDNDGWLDLFVVNWDTSDELFHNDRGRGFTRKSESIMAHRGLGHSASWCDVNDDGLLDLFVPRYNESNWLLENQGIGAENNHWLRVRLVGGGLHSVGGNNDALGAKIQLFTPGLTQLRQIDSMSGRAGQAPPWQHFGLGTETTIDSLVINWPDGLKTTLLSDDIPQVDRIITVGAGTPTGEVPIVSTTANSACAVTAHLSANVSTAQIFYRLNNETNFTSMAMINNGGGSWSHVFQPTQVTMSGIQYYIMAFSQTDSTVLPEGAPDSILAHIVISDDDITAFDLEKRVHAMCGMPARPDSTNVDWLFRNLGDYGSSRWRYWTTPYNEISGKYVEHDAAALPEPGQGFWIVAGSDQNISLAGSSTPLDRPFVFPLEPGWNLIANPFTFPVPVDWITLPIAADQAYHHFDADSTETGPYLTVDTLQASAGYFVWLGGTQSDNLTIDIVQRGRGQKVCADNSLTDPFNDDFGWSVKIAARADDRVDGSCIFGQREGATSARDRYDFMKPPNSPGRYVHLSFQDGDGNWLMNDWRGTSTCGQIWTLFLKSNLLGESCTIEFIPVNVLPEGWRLVAIEEGRIEGTDLLDHGVLTARIDSRAFTRSWRIVAGQKDYIAEVLNGVEQEFTRDVTVLSLSSAWPNPFQSTVGTTISLSVPENTTGALQVFDVRGRLVRTLHSGKLKRGREPYVWYGKDNAGQRLASGIYFIRITTPEASLVKKVMLVR